MSRLDTAPSASRSWRSDLATLLFGLVRSLSRTAGYLEKTADRLLAQGATSIEWSGRLWFGLDALAGKKFRLLLTVMAVVLLLSGGKAMVHELGLEFLTLNPLVTSAIGGAIFLIGFLLSGVLADYKEAERLPADIRVSLEAVNDDVTLFCARNHKVDAAETRGILMRIVTTLRNGLGHDGEDATEMAPVLKEVDRLSGVIDSLEQAGMAPGTITRIKNAQDSLRRSLFRIYHVQATQFVPSVHILVQTLVGAILFLLLFLTSEGTFQSALFFGFIAYIFVYALYLIEMLEQPFRKGSGSMDDVSLFLLYEFAEKTRSLGAGSR